MILPYCLSRTYAHVQANAHACTHTRIRTYTHTRVYYTSAICRKSRTNRRANRIVRDPSRNGIGIDINNSPASENCSLRDVWYQHDHLACRQRQYPAQRLLDPTCLLQYYQRGVSSETTTRREDYLWDSSLSLNHVIQGR